jgi:putative ATP-dependent endonuclease of OLD family
VILVEGDAENILLPTFAKKIGRDLSQHGVSIVNVGSTAFLRYSNIFLRKDDKKLNLNISLITDVDVRPSIHEDKQTKNKKDEFGINVKGVDNKNIKVDMTPAEIEDKRISSALEIRNKFEDPIIAFVAPHWTLEYCIAKSCLSELFHQAVYICHKTKSKDYVYQEEEKVQLVKAAKIEYEGWKDQLSDDEIAYNIYKKIMLDKKLSKAVVAQVFADLIIKADFDDVEADENLSYLVNAIKNVTGK